MEVLDCTYNNRAEASLTFVKDAEIDDGTEFSYTTSGGLSPAAFDLVDGGSTTYSDLLPGTYGATETVPAGWNLDSMDCDNGDTADAVTLVAGDDVTCTFVNTIRGSVTVEKVADRDGVDFDFTGSLTGSLPSLPTSLQNGGSFTDSGLTSGTYDVAETVPAGWNLVSQTCDSLDPPSAIKLDEPGQSITCTFVNEIQRGAIVVSKTTKQATDPETGDPVGTVPHAGVDFTVTNATNGTDVTMATDANGEACFDGLPVSVLDGDYTVTESVPSGYANDDSTLMVSVSESTCADGDGVPAVFENIPLTNVTISVDSQVDGATASVMECTRADGQEPIVTSGSTGADGDGSLTVTDLRPTDPEVTITCTVVVDP